MPSIPAASMAPKAVGLVSLIDTVVARSVVDVEISRAFSRDFKSLQSCSV